MSVSSWSLFSCLAILAAVTLYAFREWRTMQTYQRRRERLTCEDIVRRAQARARKDADR